MIAPAAAPSVGRWWAPAVALAACRATVFLPHMNLAQARQPAEGICREVSGGTLAQKAAYHAVSMSWGAVSTNASTCTSIIGSPRPKSPARPPRTAAAAASRCSRTPTKA